MDAKIIAIAVVAILAVSGVGAYYLLSGDQSPQDSTYGEDGKILAQKCDPYTITDAAGRTYTFDHTFGPAALPHSEMGGAFFTLAALTGKELPAYIAGMNKTSFKNSTFGYIFDEMPGLEKTAEITNEAAAVLASGSEIYIDYLPAQTTNEAVGGLKESLDKAGIPLLYINYHSEDPQVIADGIRMIGKLWGLNEKADKLADLYLSKSKYIFDNAEKLIAKNGGVRPEICAEWQGNLDEVKTSWNKTIQWGALIYGVGGSNLEDDGPTYPQLTLSNILASQPTTMMFSGNVGYGDRTIHIGYGYDEERTVKDTIKLFEGADAREGYKDLPAWSGDHKNVYVVNHMLNRNIFGFATVEFIAKMVWPEEYKDLTPAKDLEAFWNEWLPFSYQGCWLVDVGEYLDTHVS